MPPPHSFHTPGRRLPYADSYIIIDQCYVQHLPAHPLPNPSKPNPPILFIHGGGLTGTTFESTPDSRPGWAPLAASLGHAVYILDLVDYVRSARAPDSERDGEVEYRAAKEVWERFRIGPLEGWEERRGFEGGQFPVEGFDALVAGQVPRRRNGDEVEARGLSEAIERIGECLVVAHSHGCVVMQLALGEEGVRERVRKLVCVEPSMVGAGDRVCESVDTLVVWGDNLEGEMGWKAVAERYERNAPQRTETCWLSERGIKGNSHFPMCDRNSDVVWGVIQEWLDKDASEA